MQQPPLDVNFMTSCFKFYKGGMLMARVLKSPSAVTKVFGFCVWGCGVWSGWGWGRGEGVRFGWVTNPRELAGDHPKNWRGKRAST